VSEPGSAAVSGGWLILLRCLVRLCMTDTDKETEEEEEIDTFLIDTFPSFV
jgi:hypothetical protein